MTAAHHIVTTAKLALFATSTVVVNSFGIAPQQPRLPFAPGRSQGVATLGWSNPGRSPLLPPTLVPIVGGAGDDRGNPAVGGGRGTCRKSLRVEIDEDDSLTFDPDGPRITFRARKRYQTAVDEDDVIIGEDGDGGGGDGDGEPRRLKRRTLLEYLALPAEEYSVLDAGTIVKKEGMPNEFTCSVDPISFLGNEIVATIDAVVDVSPYPEGKSVIRVIGCTLEGSRLAEFANGSFDVDCTNVVMALREDTRKARDVPTLAVDCSLEISALVPREGRWLPKRLLGKSGSIVMQQMLNVLVPRFVRQLAADYDAWSLGDDSRAPVNVVDGSSEGGGEERDAVTAVNGSGVASKRRQEQETG